MKLKSLLFGSAAVLAAGTGAQAADLPTVEPVEYVRICDAFGTGYYYIPGTDTCLKIGGYVRAESHWVGGDTGFTLGDPDSFYGVHEGHVNNWTTRARGQINLDARTQTEFGLVRAYIAMEMTVGHGNTTNPTGVFPITSFSDPSYSTTNPNLASAFIQISNNWGTYTAGRTGSFFDFWGSHGYGTRFNIDDSTTDTTLFGWTFAGGNGFSFTIAAEVPSSNFRKLSSGDLFAAPFDDDHEGQEAPDGVVNIRVDQGWGSAQVMGAVRAVHDYSDPVFGIFDLESETGIGWAVGAGISIGVPGGWKLDAQGGFAEGAIGYVTSDPGALGDLDLGDPDEDLNEAWSVRAGITGPLFNPNLEVWLDGSYTEVEEGGFGEQDSYEHWAAKVGARWSPVAGLGIGPEFAYENLETDEDGAIDEAQDDYEVWGVMWRVQRSF
jgi:hypothetical protein